MSTSVIQRKHPATAGTEASRSHIAREQVGRALEKASFAVISFVTPAGKPDPAASCTQG